MRNLLLTLIILIASTSAHAKKYFYSSMVMDEVSESKTYTLHDLYMLDVDDNRNTVKVQLGKNHSLLFKMDNSYEKLGYKVYSMYNASDDATLFIDEKGGKAIIITEKFIIIFARS